MSYSDPDCYEPIERASVDELRSLQLARLRGTLAYAYASVAHYRQAFDRAGVAPEDLAELADLARFPLLTKADLRDNYPFGMFAVPRSEVVRIHASSGTTGKPTVVGYTAGDIDVWAQLMARSIHAAGGRPGDVAHVAYGYGLFTGGLGAHYGAERLGCTVVPVSGGQTERQVTLIADFEPRIILVTPSYCLNLIDEMHRQGIDPVSCSLQVGILGAEPWTDELRSEIEAEVLKVDGLTPHYQIHVDRSSNLASLTVRVERDPASPRPPQELAAALGTHIKDNIGVSARVVVTEPGEVPRSAGKAQRVVPHEATSI